MIRIEMSVPINSYTKRTPSVKAKPKKTKSISFEEVLKAAMGKN